MMTPTYKFALVEGLEEDFLPRQGEPTATGWDVRAALTAQEISVEPFQFVKIPLGFRVLCPSGWWLRIYPRSSTFVKKHLHSLYGIIDTSFEGQCMFVAQYIPNGIQPKLEFSPYDKGVRGVEYDHEPLVIKYGDALGQLVPEKFQDMNIEAISTQEYDRLAAERGFSRGAGGFGSTDKKESK